MGSYFNGMGMILDYDSTQVVEWGDLGTLAAIETRHTVRSSEPTLDSSFSTESNFAFLPDPANVTACTIFGTTACDQVQAAAKRALSEAEDPQYVIVCDEQCDLAEVAFVELKEKPWQIFVISAMMAPHVGLDTRDAASLPETSQHAEEFAVFGDDTIPTDGFGAWHCIIAGMVTNTSGTAMAGLVSPSSESDSLTFIRKTLRIASFLAAM